MKKLIATIVALGIVSGLVSSQGFFAGSDDDFDNNPPFMNDEIAEEMMRTGLGGGYVGPYSNLSIRTSGQFAKTSDPNIEVYAATFASMAADDTDYDWLPDGSLSNPNRFVLFRSHQTRFFINVKDDRALNSIHVAYRSGTNSFQGIDVYTETGYKNGRETVWTKTDGGFNWFSGLCGPRIICLDTSMIPNGDPVSIDLSLNGKVICTVNYDPAELEDNRYIINVSARPTTTEYYGVVTTNRFINVDDVEDKYDKIRVVQIGEKEYVKIRDAAALLEGTAKQFAIGYDPALRSLSMTTGQPYTAVGGEFGRVSTPIASVKNPSSTIILDGKPTTVELYMIEGNNFISVHDLFELLDCGVEYRVPYPHLLDLYPHFADVKSMIYVDTNKSYSE
jgi:hypothetical protein